MGKGKDYKTTEIEEIRSWIKDGLTYKEVAELMGRTEKAIRNIASKYGFSKTSYSNRKAPKEIEQSLFVPLVEVKEKPVQEVPVAEQTPVVQPIKAKTLDDFTPREIFKNLHKRGYCFKPGSITCKRERVIVEEIPVNIEDVING